MMTRFGSEREYKRQLIHAFKHADEPEIIIVVDMLLTGFDAPRNTVLYLTKMLKGHSLLQAIARVNRLYDGKDFGYIIDYRGVQNLDEALDIYGTLAEFDQEGLDDLCTTLTDVRAEADKLPQRHSDLWELFHGIKNRRDAEEYERLLADESLRTTFKERLSIYSRTLATALSSVRFLEETPADKIARYKNDLKFFMQLYAAVRRRYAEVVDFKEYEGKIQKLIDTMSAREKSKRLPTWLIFLMLRPLPTKSTSSAVRPPRRTPLPTVPRRPSRNGWEKTRPFTRSFPNC